MKPVVICPCITLYRQLLVYYYIIFNQCLHITTSTSVGVYAEKLIVPCISTCNYGKFYRQHSIFSLFLQHDAVFCFPLLMVSFFFYPSPSFSPLSSSLFHSLSFLQSQCNVIQDRCRQPRLWHCNLCSGCQAACPRQGLMMHLPLPTKNK